MVDRFILSHIQRLPMVARFNDTQLEALANAFHERNYRAGEALYREGEDSHALYLLVSGGAQLYRSGQPQGAIMPGQYVGESSLYSPAARDATAAITADSVVLALSRADLLAAIAARPDLRDALTIRPEWLASLSVAPAPAQAQASYQQSQQQPYQAPPNYQNYQAPPQYPGAVPPMPANMPPTLRGGLAGENVLLNTHRHPWVFASKALRAVILLAVCLSLAILASRLPPGLQLVSTGLCGIGIIVPALLIAYWWLQWLGDTFTVTDQRIVHNRRVFPSGADRRDQVLMTAVQNVDVQRSGYLAELIGFGDLIIATAGAPQPMILDKLPNPIPVQRLIMAQVERSAPVPGGFAPGYPPPANYGRSGITAPIRGSGGLFPHVREVIGDQVIYRKHWGVLVGYELKPAVAVALLLALLALRSSVSGPVTIAFPASTVISISASWLFVAGLWALWEYRRWYNSQYILDNSEVIDIMRRPLGLREVRIQAGLMQIQNVTSMTTSLWGSLFNYGNVVIQTAAEQGEMVFVGVHNPGAVADEVLQRVRNYGAQRAAAQQASEMQMMAGMIANYRPGMPQGNYPPVAQPYPPSAAPANYPPNYPPPTYNNPPGTSDPYNPRDPRPGQPR
ncbi:MAG: Crp/Fnr family transcriptional regulator [Aggregatilineales bacterium]